MGKMEKTSMEFILNNAINTAKEREGHVLVSITKKAGKVEPLSFFASAQAFFDYRTYWASTMEDFTLVGAGKVMEIRAEEIRYKHLSEQWTSLCQDAIIHNPYETPGTGLLALGGMSFDPLKKRTSLWKNFPEGQLYIPAFLLTKSSDRYYLTANLQVSATDTVSGIRTYLEENERHLMKNERLLQKKSQVQTKVEVAPEQWKEAVAKAIKEIKATHAEKIVMARELQLAFSEPADIPSILSNLLHTQSDSYIFAYDYNGDCFVGASPERLVKVEQQKLLSTCLAGTAPRGETEIKDAKISEEFLHDKKNLDEHDFVVQMIRKSIENYCHDIDIPSKPVIRKLKNLQHLYTPVQATLNNGVTIFDIIEQLHPTPALGGTPTKKALEFMRHHELLDRGWYGAPVGWLDYRNYGEFIVAIRSGLISAEKASLFAGCGIVSNSDIEAEYKETKMKFLPMLHAIDSSF